jgi:hypothetical protein
MSLIQPVSGVGLSVFTAIRFQPGRDVMRIRSIRASLLVAVALLANAAIADDTAGGKRPLLTDDTAGGKRPLLFDDTAGGKRPLLTDDTAGGKRPLLTDDTAGGKRPLIAVL